MKIQTLIDSESMKEERISFLENWEEISYSLKEEEMENGTRVLILEVPDEEFEKLLDIFPSKSEAMGAFVTTALENGWEEVPESYVVYHADFDGNKVLAGIKTPQGTSVHDQLHLEQMIQTMMRFPRIVVYSSEVLTYIKDLFPEVDSRAYVIAREIARAGKKVPDLAELAKIYGQDIRTIEGKLELIEKLLKNPVRLPDGEVSIRPYYLPTG